MHATTNGAFCEPSCQFVADSGLDNTIVVSLYPDRQLALLNTQQRQEFCLSLYPCMINGRIHGIGLCFGVLLEFFISETEVGGIGDMEPC